MFICRKHQGKIRAGEKWNGKQHQRWNERHEWKAGHLDCLIGGEQRWRLVIGQTYKDKHNFTNLQLNVIECIYNWM